jgi:hypothetical protein
MPRTAKRAAKRAAKNAGPVHNVHGARGSATPLLCGASGRGGSGPAVACSACHAGMNSHPGIGGPRVGRS